MGDEMCFEYATPNIQQQAKLIYHKATINIKAYASVFAVMLIVQWAQGSTTDRKVAVARQSAR